MPVMYQHEKNFSVTKFCMYYRLFETSWDCRSLTIMSFEFDLITFLRFVFCTKHGKELEIFEATWITVFTYNKCRNKLWAVSKMGFSQQIMNEVESESQEPIFANLIYWKTRKWITRHWSAPKMPKWLTIVFSLVSWISIFLPFVLVQICHFLWRFFQCFKKHFFFNLLAKLLFLPRLS